MQPDSYVTLEAYLTLDAEADVKHEYRDGRVIAMAGAEPEHNQLTVNLAFGAIAPHRGFISHSTLTMRHSPLYFPTCK